MKNILIIEDEIDLNDSLKEIFEKEGYNVFSAYSYDEAAKKIKEEIDIFLIDINLGYLSGFELFKKIKKKINLENKICIFLTARDSIEDNVIGLDLGADDYITKPFNVEVLLSKIRNLIRKKEKTTKIEIGEYILDIKKKKLYKKENLEEIPLTYLEYEIIERFFEKKDWIISRDELKDLIYEKTDHYVNDNTVSVYIKRIREKLKNEDKDFLISIRGMGYKINEN